MYCFLVSLPTLAEVSFYTAGAEKAVKLTKEQGWTIVSMKEDWQRVFLFQDDQEGASRP
jgi:hypothetical protein